MTVDRITGHKNNKTQKGNKMRQKKKVGEWFNLQENAASHFVKLPYSVVPLKPNIYESIQKK